jgi:uncharacterized protein
LVASNGDVIATSETYQSKASALNGVESVQRHAGGAGIDDQTSTPTAQAASAGRLTTSSNH